MNGSVMPVIGKRPVFTPILTKDWMKIHVLIPPAMSIENLFGACLAI